MEVKKLLLLSFILTTQIALAEEFIPSKSPYYIINPIETGVYSIEFTPSCNIPILLNKTDNNIFILSQCSFNSIYVNFLVPPGLEVSQIIDEKWIRPEQKVFAMTNDKNYYVIQTNPDTLGVFMFTKKPSPIKIKEQTIKKILIEYDNKVYEKLLSIIKNIIRNFQYVI